MPKLGALGCLASSLSCDFYKIKLHARWLYRSLLLRLFATLVVR